MVTAPTHAFQLVPNHALQRFGLCLSISLSLQLSISLSLYFSISLTSQHTTQHTQDNTHKTAHTAQHNTTHNTTHTQHNTHHTVIWPRAGEIEDRRSQAHPAFRITPGAWQGPQLMWRGCYLEDPGKGVSAMARRGVIRDACP